VSSRVPRPAGCGDGSGDTAAVAATLAAIQATCECGGSKSHGAYVSCATGITNARAAASPRLLPTRCKGAVERCVAGSSCGKGKSERASLPPECPTAPPPSGCCGDASFHSFTVADSAGDCGDLVTTAGASSDLACSALYLGGPGTVAEVPATPPDLGRSISAITSCTGQAATLGPATSADTGSNRTCTDVGCLFGAPLAIATPVAPVVSTCLVTRLASPLAGTLDCASGAETQSLDLAAVVYLSGDFAVDPFDTIPGAQPCPLCSGGTCIGGPNDGLACTAGTTDLGDGYPTSHDCPPDPMLAVGTLPLAFTLTTGTTSWTATAADNDDGTVPDQAGVFSGYCRDADETATFANPAEPCWENGGPVGPACAGVFETCEQRTGGAFGPGGASNTTITVVGVPQAGIASGPAAGTLVGIFSVPPIFNVTFDSAYDLPGPGAVTLAGTGALCADAMACP
jgi:hypothetical protein